MKDSVLKQRLVELYELFYEKKRIFRLRLYYHLNIMLPDQTIRYIEKNHCNIARFGDGEFDLIFGKRDLHFQPKNEGISIDLKRVFECSNQRNLLLCIPRCMNTIRGCNNHAGSFWIQWGKCGHHELIVDMIRDCVGKHYRFGDSQITRPYIDWVDDKRAKRTFPKLRHLWENRDIIIIEGEQTRMGVGNDLFDNAKTIKRILCPAVNAYEHIEQIKDSILRNYNGELILMALGPTATILATDFSKLNIWALDIGNIDIEYEWFLRGAKERIVIPGKFTNEAKNGLGRAFSECRDQMYLSQIIDRVGCKRDEIT